MIAKQVFRAHTDIALPGDTIIIEKYSKKLAITVKTRRFGIRKFKSYRPFPFTVEVAKELYLKALKYLPDAPVAVTLFEVTD